VTFFPIFTQFSFTLRSRPSRLQPQSPFLRSCGDRVMAHGSFSPRIQASMVDRVEDGDQPGRVRLPQTNQRKKSLVHGSYRSHPQLLDYDFITSTCLFSNLVTLCITTYGPSLKRPHCSRLESAFSLSLYSYGKQFSHSPPLLVVRTKLSCGHSSLFPFPLTRVGESAYFVLRVPSLNSCIFHNPFFQFSFFAVGYNDVIIWREFFPPLFQRGPPI